MQQWSGVLVGGVAHQPFWKNMLVKVEIFPRGEHKTCLKPPPRVDVTYPYAHIQSLLQVVLQKGFWDT